MRVWTSKRGEILDFSALFSALSLGCRQYNVNRLPRSQGGDATKSVVYGFTLLATTPPCRPPRPPRKPGALHFVFYLNLLTHHHAKQPVMASHVVGHYKPSTPSARSATAQSSAIYAHAAELPVHQTWLLANRKESQRSTTITLAVESLGPEAKPGYAPGPSLVSPCCLMGICHCPMHELIQPEPLATNLSAIPKGFSIHRSCELVGHPVGKLYLSARSFLLPNPQPRLYAERLRTVPVSQFAALPWTQRFPKPGKSRWAQLCILIRPCCVLDPEGSVPGRVVVAGKQIPTRHVVGQTCCFLCTRCPGSGVNLVNPLGL
ncbi:hypothetical protein B0T24DRAFT_383538 [Lasiosphaeria ovina]|uniref:Uncharacterized protein n=1 Tax=Lasiosphaeria ovina TaxID=92902 RepID=A0AAE0N1V3_9PEZI|nr:hypothetical protein B0T24DRAFT_383538 [Lasiosphaeria ovina]